MNAAVARPWLILALIFVLGAVTGSLLTVGFGPRFVPGPLDAKEMRAHWMMHLATRLHLTDDQQAKIRPIIADAETQIEAVHRDDVGRISVIMQQASASIAKVLTPDQQAELQKMEHDREQMFQRHMHGPRGPEEDARPGEAKGPRPPQP